MAEIYENGAMLTVGTVLKNTYQIEDYLASGGFGNTYVARNIAFDELVAIKEFFISGVTERDNHSSTISVSNTTNQGFFEEQLNKFKKEARRLRKLKHQNIVEVHDLFEENGTAYYVMDYIEGESLAQRIKRTGMPIGEKDAMNYFMQVLDALETVHDMGILHLDLKPGNIMLDNNGTVKLIDFGASKQQGGIGGGATTSTAVAYTNGYAPREQMEQNINKFGPWTDLYALGATLYNMLTTYGPPLPSDLDDDRTPDKSRALPMPYVSLNAKRLLLWMMNTSRMDRPQSVAQVRQFLLGSQGPKTVVSPARGQTVPPQAPPYRQQPQTPPYGQPPRQPQGNRQQIEVVPLDEPEKKSGISKKLIIAGFAAGLLLAILALAMFSGGDDTMDGGEVKKELATGKTVNDLDYTIDKLGICKYSGTVNEAGQPHGEGTASFADGRKYVGPFVNGKCQGKNAVFTYGNGDTFEGSFDNNLFKEGKYTNVKAGEYFVGTFTNGQPDKGKWYDKNGKEL